MVATALLLVGCATPSVPLEKETPSSPTTTDSSTTDPSDTAGTDTADTGTTPTETTGDCAPTAICAAGACTWDGDVAVFELSGTILLNGASLPEGSLSVDLWDAGAGLVFSAYTEGDTYTVRAPAGDYVVSIGTGTRGFEGSWLLAGNVDLSVDTLRDFEVTAHAVSGTVSSQGLELDRGSDWRVVFTDTSAGYRYEAQVEPEYARSIPPGTYDVTLYPAYAEQSGTWPAASAAEVGADTTLDLHLQASRVSGTLSLGGVPVADTQEWTLAFTEATTGHTYSVAGRRAAYRVDLPDGTYAVTLTTETAEWLLADAEVVSGDRALDLDAEQAVVSGSLAFDGTPVAVGVGWMLEFADTTTGRVFTTEGDGPAYTLPVAPGIHAVTLWYATHGGAWRLGEMAVSGPTTADLDVAAVTISGALSFDGSPVSDTDEWVLRFSDTASDDYFTARGTGPGYTLVAPPGTYRAYINATLATEGLWPHGEDLVVGVDAAVDLAFTTFAVSGTLAVDGQPLGDEFGGTDWHLRFQDLETGHYHEFGGDGPAYEALLPAGIFDVTMQGGSGTSYDAIWPLGYCLAVGE